MQSNERENELNENESEAINPEVEGREEDTTVVESDVKNTVPILPFDQRYLLVFFTTVESFGKKVCTSETSLNLTNRHCLSE